MEEGIFNTELGRKFLALVKASLKVSDLITDLALRGKIKSQVLDVYRIFIEKDFHGLPKEIDILDSYIFLAGHLNLIKEEHCRALRNGFLVFKSRIIILINEPPKAEPSLPADSTPREKKEIVKPGTILNERQKKILKYFEEHEQVRLAEILDLFPDVSEKTVRNELASLVDLKKITRSGQGSGSSYQIVR